MPEVTVKTVLNMMAWVCVHDGGCLSVLQGTDRDEQHLNIFLEFVPGGSIANLLAKFGALSAVQSSCTRTGLCDEADSKSSSLGETQQSAQGQWFISGILCLCDPTILPEARIRWPAHVGRGCQDKCVLTGVPACVWQRVR